MKYLLTVLFFSFLIISCKTQENVPVKENPPTVFTKKASDVSLFSATLNGEVTNEGFTPVTDRGFVYSDKNNNPSLTDSKIQSSYGKGLYSIVLNKLSVNTKYYYTAYATNTKGTSYGQFDSFTTADYKLPVVITDAPKNITYNVVELSGFVSDAGGFAITERGICYGLNPNPSISDNKIVSGEGLGAFKITLQNLKDNSYYFVRAYAINSKGTGYGNEHTFNTLDASKGFRDNTTKVVEVKSKTGRIWMDRNLGASQVATSPTDEKAYGDLYQWGRGADGHEKRNSSIINLLSSTDVPGNGNFIITVNSSVYDWRSPQNNNLWQGVSGANNPCPSGYRLPSETEWESERASWSSNNLEGAFTSALKLPAAGYRFGYNGGLYLSGGTSSSGNYWSYWVLGTDSSRLNFSTSDASVGRMNRAVGNCVRCIKD
jgi:uncharacterized protein (TIGR02145 family)